MLAALDELASTVVAVMILFAVVNVTIFLIFRGLASRTHVSNDHDWLLTSTGWVCAYESTVPQISVGEHYMDITTDHGTPRRGEDHETHANWQTREGGDPRPGSRVPHAGQTAWSAPPWLAPVPAQAPLTWNVMVALRQWNRVKDSLAANQEDQLIIEGYPLMQGTQHVLLAQSCISMLQQRAQKQAQQAQQATPEHQTEPTL